MIFPMFVKRRATILLCGAATREHAFFIADRVTQEVLDDRRICPTCIKAYKEEGTNVQSRSG